MENSSSVHIDNKKKDILVIGKGLYCSTQEVKDLCITQKKRKKSKIYALFVCIWTVQDN